MPVWLGCMIFRRARGSICVAAARLPSGSRVMRPMLAAISSRAARRRRRAGGLTAGELDEAVGHVELAVARLDDGAHVGAGVEAQQRRQLEVLALAADVEAGGDGRRVLVDDDGDGAHGAAVGEPRLDLDGHGALVERAERRGENDGVAGGIDGAAGEHPGADLVPSRSGLRRRCAARLTAPRAAARARIRMARRMRRFLVLLCAASMPARRDRHNGPSKDDAAPIAVARHRRKSEKAMAEQRQDDRSVMPAMVAGDYSA